MDFTPASAASVAAFLVLVALVIAAFLAAVWHAARTQGVSVLPPTLRAGLGLSIWLALLSGFVASGLMPRLSGQGAPHFFGAVILVSMWAGLSPLGARLAASIPVAALVGFQAFRLPLELVLHSWAEQGTIPGAMTWTGQNWDVFAGATALLAAPFAQRWRGVAWAANLIGFALLLNVMRVAVMSSPLPFAWGQEPPLLLALYLPYAWIGPVCVGGALCGHIVLTRALLRPPHSGRRV